MRKLIVSMNLTLDGFMSGPGCELDWHFMSWTKEMGDALCRQLAQADTILLGRVTYLAMAKYWPSKVADPLCRGGDFGFANMMNTHRKLVISETLTHTGWQNSVLAKGNIRNEISKQKKSAGKNIIVYGSGMLVTALMDSDLIDEYQLWIHPVILGEGKRLFNRAAREVKTKLLGSETFPSGVVLLQYQIIKTNNHEHNKQKSKR